MSATWWTLPIRRIGLGEARGRRLRRHPGSVPCRHDDGRPGQRRGRSGSALPPPLERLRPSRGLRGRVGVPAHVTLLFPFMPVAALRPPSALAGRIASAVEPFDVRFAAVGTLPGRRLARCRTPRRRSRTDEAVAARFPAHPALRGRVRRGHPPPDLVESPTAPLDRDRRGRPAASAVHAAGRRDGDAGRGPGRALAKPLADPRLGARR